PGYPLPRLSLVIGRAAGRDRIHALPAPESQTPSDRWRAAFPLNQAIVDDPDVEFSLYAAGRLVELDPPRARRLGAEREPSRREQLRAQRERQEQRLASLEDVEEREQPEPPSAEPPRAEPPRADAHERPRRRFAEPAADVVDDDVELVEAEIVDEAAESEE